MTNLGSLFLVLLRNVQIFIVRNLIFLQRWRGHIFLHAHPASPPGWHRWQRLSFHLLLLRFDESLGNRDGYGRWNSVGFLGRYVLGCSFGSFTDTFNFFASIPPSIVVVVAITAEPWTAAPVVDGNHQTEQGEGREDDVVCDAPRR